MPVPRSKGSRIALIVETSNVESPTQMIYTGMYNHYKGRFRCFVFDNQFEVARFLLRQNQSVQKTPFVNKFCLKPPKVVQSRRKVRKKTNTKGKDDKIPCTEALMR